MIGLAQAHERDDRQRRAPPVQMEMGELAALVSIYEKMLLSHETDAPSSDGMLWPSETRSMRPWRCSPSSTARMLEIVRELAGAAMITLPSSGADFDNPEIRADIERYMRSALPTPGAHRADAAGLGLHRHRIRQPPWQYEKFYGGTSSS